MSLSPPSTREDAKRAIFTIKTIVEDPEIGAIYKGGKVTRLMNFGAFVGSPPARRAWSTSQAGHEAC